MACDRNQFAQRVGHGHGQNEIHIAVPPADVFSVLSDPEAYGDWVVGSRRIRGADAGFPAVGTRFHHQVGVAPLVLNDHTEVLENQSPNRLVLRAKTRHSRRHGEGKPVTTGADDSVAEAPRTMKEHKVPRLSVIDGHELIGIISQADVARSVDEEEVGEFVEVVEVISAAS